MSSEKKVGVPSPDDRRGFLRRALLGGAVGAPVAAALTSPAPAPGQSPGRVADGIQGLLVNPLILRNDLLQIRRHEIAHVEAIVETITEDLGGEARPRPNFQNLLQRDFRTFVRTARTFENTGTGAYVGAAPAINSPDVLAGAAAIATIEGRHAGVLNFVFADPITANVLEPEVDQDFELPLTPEQVVELVDPFIRDLNGGPPLAFDPDPAGRSTENDIAILNFALALEYLEVEFYTLNFRRFYPFALIGG